MRNLVLGIVFVFLAFLGYFIASEWRASSSEGMEIATAGDCDLSAQPCHAVLPDGGRLTLSIAPRPIPLMQPLAVEIRVENSQLQPTSLDITGLNMEMGLNRTELSGSGDGRWSGETLLPICSQRQMHWQASLSLRDASQQYRLVYAFFTLRP